jgi:DNA-binding response OmpR family regulator
MKSVYRNVLRLLRIFMQILDFRKIELEKLDFRVSKNNIVPFVDSIINYFDYLARDRQVNIVLNYDRDKDLSFYFDPDKMDKIIYNVLSNALKHSPPGSKVYIKIGLTHGKKGIMPDTGNHGIRIDIDDRGTGIDKNRLGKIFEKFSNKSLAGAYESGSTGIGLSIVREFTELHGGTVQITSPYQDESGKYVAGTRVTLLFPSSETFPNKEYISSDNCRYNEIILENRLTVVENFPDDDEDDADFYENLSNGYKILVIEDDPELREMLKKEIGQFHVAIPARDGETGVKIAKETIPDLIISDIMMPGIDGYQVVSILKQSPETSHIPIIMLTAKSMQENEIQAYTTGADAFVKKPFHTKTLLHLVDSLIENRLKLKMKFFTNYGLGKALPTATDEVFFEKLMKLINDNISDPLLGVDLLTRELYMSRAQLYKKVNAVTNTSVKLFIRKIRLRKAAEILQSENISVTETAYAVGFDSLPWFSKCFQDEFGISPSKYALNRSN